MATPVVVGVVETDEGALLLTEAIQEVRPEERGERHWRSIGAALAGLHRVRSNEFGLEFDGYFGPLPQDNAPAGTWAEFLRGAPRAAAAARCG
ncbi:fructosamine kinase family protein [Dactylosporangium sp. CA-139066]|uniref:fructosamine kinase family protein n=1 Tax=Dactylosporangium sp. CA-139066 TaxID=3239930 RepID=UPI003D8AE492